MPELPEVETTTRILRETITGEKIDDFWTDSPKLLQNYAPEEFKNKIVGLEFKNISRRAKYILFHLSDQNTILAHQRMSGHFLVGRWRREGESWVPQKNKALQDQYNKYIHAIFKLGSGSMLALSSLRKFSTLKLIKRKLPKSPTRETGIKELDKLGSEPFSKKFSWDYFKKALKNRRAAIKTILMNQEIVGGIGNIYSDEILWRAKVNPKKRVNKLSKEKLKKVYENIRPVLKKALELKGTSTNEYRKPTGDKGGYTKERKVYQREGEPCPRCGEPIERVKISGRSAYFCPKCQS